MNQFDALIVVISLVEEILQSNNSDPTEEDPAGRNNEDMALTIFRGFRLLRVFRLARRWRSFHKMIVKIGQTLKDIITFFVLLLIIVFVFSLLGVQLFNNYVKVNDKNEIVPATDPEAASPR